MFFVLKSYAQETQPFRRPFVYGGFGYTPSKISTISLEAGYWGITSTTSFSLTYDVVKDLNQDEWNLNHYVGIKPYFTVHDDVELSHMVYIMPKINVVDLDDILLEFGYNPNYKISKNDLISVTLGNQVSSTAQWSLFTSIGYIRLF
jgi:hypothetical protein